MADIASIPPVLDSRLDQVRAAIAEHFAEYPEVLTRPLSALTETDALRLLEDDTIFDAMARAVGEESEAEE